MVEIKHIEKRVFSTSVEVFLHPGCAGGTPHGLLHVRGGVSLPEGKASCDVRSSPRPWRCFYIKESPQASLRVFSTSVEVFP